MFRLKLLLSLFITTQAVLAQTVSFESGAQQTPLIELYTSEGCSSCPPADRWLASLSETQGLWSQFVPVAFHVDYWDYIGWRDRFAKREYSQRQRRYAAEFNETTVYTPGVRRAGAEWRSWRRFGDSNSFAQTPEEVGELSLTLRNEGRFSASFQGVDAGFAGARQLTVALLGRSLSTHVERGENRGRELQHDFVVLQMTTLSGRTEGGTTRWNGTIPGTTTQAPEYAIAAWVSEGNSLVPLQAVGGALPMQP